MNSAKIPESGIIGVMDLARDSKLKTKELEFKENQTP